MPRSERLTRLQRRKNAKARLEAAFKVSEYNARIWRERCAELETALTECERRNAENYLRRKCAERLLASNRAQTVRELNRDDNDWTTPFG